MKPDPRRAVQAVALLAALAAGLAVASTDGSSARPPVPWVPALALLALLARTALWQRAPAWVDACGALLLGIAAGHRLLLPGFPVGHDTTTHLWGSYAFFRAIDSGNPFPAWVHELGPGIPLPLFYPPVSFYAELPFRWAGLPVYDCFKLAFLLFRALAGLSMWLVVRRWTGRSDAALVAAGAYVFAPYHLLDAHYRAALAESASMAVLPIFFLAVGRISSAPTWRSIRGGAWASALLVLTHPLTLAMASVGAGVWIAARARWRPSREAGVALAALVAALGLGTAAAGFYTIPVIAESGSTSVDHALYTQDGDTSYARYGLVPADLLTRRPWDRLRTLYPHGVEPPDTPMPFYFGWGWLGCIALAACLPWLSRQGQRQGQEASETRAGWRGLPSVAIVALVLCLHPLSVALGALPVLPVLQFPWRFLAIATFAASALAAPALLAVTSAVRAPGFVRVAPALLLALLVADAWPGLGAPAWHSAYSGIPRAGEWQRAGAPLPLRVDRLRYPPADPRIELSLYRRAYAEYQNPEAYAAYSGATRATLERMSVSVAFAGWTGPPTRLAPEPYAAFTPIGGRGATELPFDRGGGRISVSLPAKAGRLVVKEQWFPGWQARLDGSAADIEVTPDGLMRLRVPPGGERELELTFSRLYGPRLAGWLVTAVAVLGLLWPMGEEEIGMGLLVDGEWQDEWYDTKGTKGHFVRKDSSFRQRVSADGSSGFPAASGRYHLYVSYACPWAHRALVYRALHGLEDAISISVVDPLMASNGWQFGSSPGCIPDTVNGARYLHEIYTRADPHYTGRVTVPVLWDKREGTIVNNESSEIIRMLDSEFDAFGDASVDFTPADLLDEIDATNELIYPNVNDGVYRCGFATTQEAYEEAFERLFATLDELDDRLGRSRYLVGDRITEADWRLFTTLVRFDAVYVGHFKCNRNRIADTANLSGYLRELYQVPGVRETVNFEHIKRHYYESHLAINPTAIVPVGPELDLERPPGRDGRDGRDGRAPAGRIGKS